MPFLKSIRQFTVAVWKEFQECQLLGVASSLAYTTLLSIIPLLAVSFAIFQAFGGLDRLQATLEPVLISNLATGSGEAASEYLRRFIRNAHAGAIGATGFLGLFVTSVSLLYSIDKAILLEQLRRQVYESWWMALAETILMHDPRGNVDVRGHRSELRQERIHGLCVVRITALSQILAHMAHDSVVGGR